MNSGSASCKNRVRNLLGETSGEGRTDEICVCAGPEHVRLSALVVVVVVAAGLAWRVSGGRGDVELEADHPRARPRRADADAGGPAGPASNVTLYDQYDNAGAFSTNSQNYEAAFNQYDDELADDFIVPAGLGWNIDTVEVGGEYFNGPGPATSVNVNFYSNGAGNLPGRSCTRARTRRSRSGPSFSIPLSPVVSLGAGHVLGLGAGEPDVQHHGPVGLARPHRDVEQRARPGGTPTAGSSLRSARPGDAGRRRATSIPRRPTRSTGSSGRRARRLRRRPAATTATTATTATAGRLHRRRDHDPRLRTGVPYPRPASSPASRGRSRTST